MAATGSKHKQQLSFALSYGLAGGRLHSTRFRKLMQEAGFRPEKKERADILVAHSAGCWLIPKDCHPKFVMYIGMPLATDKPRETWQKAVRSGYSNNSYRRSFKITLKNVFHSLLQPRRNLNIIRSAASAQVVIMHGVPGIFISNRHDPWPKGKQLDRYVADSDNWTFIGLPGTHDDIWDHPERYVDIIRHYARVLG